MNLYTEKQFQYAQTAATELVDPLAETVQNLQLCKHMAAHAVREQHSLG